MQYYTLDFFSEIKCLVENDLVSFPGDNTNAN